MKFVLNQDRVLGLIALAVGLVLVFYWAPVDSETGLVERVRGRSAIGDAMAPSVAGTIIGLSGLWLIVAGGNSVPIGRGNVAWLIGLLAVLGLSLSLMRWFGPAVVEAVTGADYRPQRDTPPWKYAGYLIGGTVMIAGLIFLVERRLHWSRILIALGVSSVLAMLYDLPFDNLILPPNGDV